MEERCNQMQNCKDASDKTGSKILENSYNKRVPPVGTTGREVKPVIVNVSMILYKVVAILLLLL